MIISGDGVVMTSCSHWAPVGHPAAARPRLPADGRQADTVGICGDAKASAATPPARLADRTPACDRFVAGELDNASFAGIARAMGADGAVVDALDQVGPALRQAVDAQMNRGRTTVLEIVCGRELDDPFPRDALSEPVRFLEKYQDYV